MRRTPKSERIRHERTVMSKKAIVLLAEGFEEIEAATPIDTLRRAGVDVMAAGIGGTSIKGAHGITYCADAALTSDIAGAAYDLVVFPGGMPGAKHLGESPEARKLALEMHGKGALVAAICAAPVMTLGAWGILDGRRATCYPGMEPMFPSSVVFSPERVVQDGAIVTSRGPGTALEFSIALVRLLVGEETAGTLAEGMLLRA